MKRRNICILKPCLWAKYCSQGIYKASKTSSCLPAKDRYSNNHLSRRLSYPGKLPRGVKSQHSANTGPLTAARLRHKLGKLRSGPHPVIDISRFLHKLTDEIIQSSRKKNNNNNNKKKHPDHSKQNSTNDVQPHPISSRSGKLHKHIRGCLPRHLEGPSLLEALTNTAHKVFTYISSQLRDTCVPEQQCSGRTTVVATEFKRL